MFSPLISAFTALKKFTIGNTQHPIRRIPPLINYPFLDTPDAQDKPWSNMAMSGPCTFADMGKPFKNVLSNYNPRLLQLFKTLGDDDELKLKVGNTAKFDITQHDLKMVMEGKLTTENNNVTTSLAVKASDEKSLCVESKYKDILSFKTGVSQKMDEENADKKIFTNAQFKHTSVVLDAGIDCTFDDSEEKSLGLNLSAVVGRVFNNFGFLAGIDLAKKHSDPEWKNICQSVSVGAVFPQNAIQLTLHPNTNQCSLNGYWKMNNIEIAAILKNNFRSPEWSGKNNEIGLKYEHSENTTVGIKSNLDGDVSLGLWHKNEGFKFGLFYQHILRQCKEIGDVGLSVEF